MSIRTWLVGQFMGMFADQSRKLSGKDSVQRCWRCDAGIARTADGFHQIRPGAYARCAHSADGGA